MFSITKKFFQPRNSKLHKHFLIACIGIGLLKIMSVDCFAAVITPPAKKEKEASPPRQVVSKLTDSSQVLSKPSQKEIGSVFSRVGTESRQFRLKGSAKSGASSGVTGLKVVAPSNKPDERGKQDGTKNGVGVEEEGFNHFAFWLCVAIALLPLWLANDPYGGLKPNVELRGEAKATLLRSPSRTKGST